MLSVEVISSAEQIRQEAHETMNRWQSRSSIVLSGTRSRLREMLVIIMSLLIRLLEYSSIRNCCPSLTRNTERKKSDGSVWVWTGQGVF